MASDAGKESLPEHLDKGDKLFCLGKIFTTACVLSRYPQSLPPDHCDFVAFSGVPEFTQGSVQAETSGRLVHPYRCLPRFANGLRAALIREC
jgi:hypothetical protein